MFSQITWIPNSAFGWLTLILRVYVVIGLLLYFGQSWLLFPAPKNYEKATPRDAGLPFEDLHIAVNETGYLHAWWIPSALPSDRVVLMFHGNGYVLENMVATEATMLHEIGTNLLLVDYRGYGGSTRVTPNESTVTEDARSALKYLRSDRGIPLDRIFVLGRSIGSGPATQLAVENPALGGLILESPFSSIQDAAGAMPLTRIYPVNWMLRTHFDNLSKISSVRTPLLVISGTADTLTPAWMAKEIFARANQPKLLHLVPNAGHDDLLEVGGQGLTKVLQSFVRSH